MNDTTEGQKRGRKAEWAGKRGYEGSGKERSDDCVQKGPVREKGGTAEIGRPGCDETVVSITKAQVSVNAGPSLHTPLIGSLLPIMS